MTPSRKHFSIKRLALGFVITVLVALGMSGIMITKINAGIRLLEAHETAMSDDSLRSSDPYTIPNLSQDLKDLRWTSLGTMAVGFTILYTLSVFFSRHTANDRKAMEADQMASSRSAPAASWKDHLQPAGPVEFQTDLIGDLSRNQLIQFSIVSFIIMFILATGISLLISIRLNHNVELLGAHGAAMMDGSLDPDAPYSIPNILEDVRNLRMTVVIAVGSAYLLLYGSLVSIVWRGVTERRQLEVRLRRALAQMETLAMTDSLTGLLNRRAIREHAAAELERVRREKTDMSLILLDLDHLKAINDDRGHAFGDQALKALAGNLIATKRSYDWLGRWGGDEFLLVLPGTTLPEAVEVAERIQVGVRNLILKQGEVGTVRLEVSLGISSTSGIDGENPTLDALLRQADKALYHAKSKGRNRASKFSQGRLIALTGPAPA